MVLVTVIPCLEWWRYRKEHKLLHMLNVHCAQCANRDSSKTCYDSMKRREPECSTNIRAHWHIKWLTTPPSKYLSLIQTFHFTFPNTLCPWTFQICNFFNIGFKCISNVKGRTFLNIIFNKAVIELHYQDIRIISLDRIEFNWTEFITVCLHQVAAHSVATLSQ